VLLGKLLVNSAQMSVLTTCEKKQVPTPGRTVIAGDLGQFNFLMGPIDNYMVVLYGRTRHRRTWWPSSTASHGSTNVLSCEFMPMEAHSRQSLSGVVGLSGVPVDPGF